ncbi:class I SAM-dependent methyltransferase [Myxococcota bacterium]|nr:class I SAM-dependent methyltransferase [Myxococcota bacterium]
MNPSSFPPRAFERMDEQPDPWFYDQPRFVVHIDPSTIKALTACYRDEIPEGAAILDLMSSWVSHLPDDRDYAEVVGLGLNSRELEENPRLNNRVVHDLNTSPELPFPDARFDTVINAVSVQYLTRPAEVFASVQRVLAPGGTHIVAYSHRMFPTKAVAIWRSLPPNQLHELVESYFSLSSQIAGAGDWEDVQSFDRSPATGDPLWITLGRASSSNSTETD